MRRGTSTSRAPRLVYACRQPRAADSGYRFEVDGVPVRPDFVSLAGDDVLRPGDIIRLRPADMIAGPPGHYRYFADPARPDALDLRQLRGLALATWSDDIAAAVARLDGAQLLVSFDLAHSRVADALPLRPSALPPDLRALKLDVALDNFLTSPPPGPIAPEPFALDALPALSELRSLELRVARSAAEYLDAAALARFPVLQRLVLDRSVSLRDPQQLRALPELRVLDLDNHDEVRDVAFVRELPTLRWLDMAYTGVGSLEPLANHPVWAG